MFDIRIDIFIYLCASCEVIHAREYRVIVKHEKSLNGIYDMINVRNIMLMVLRDGFIFALTMSNLDKKKFRLHLNKMLFSIYRTSARSIEVHVK